MNRYIDAEAFYEALYKETADYSELEQRSGEDYSWLWRKAFYRVFNSFPTADVVEVRRGRWKPFDLTWGRSVYVCTFCGEALEVPTECGKPMYEFCPCCGAKMVNEDE